MYYARMPKSIKISENTFNRTLMSASFLNFLKIADMFLILRNSII